MEIRGMRCGMCEAHVNDVLRKVKGVKKASSRHSKNLATVVCENYTDIEELRKAVAGEGYEVGDIEVSDYARRGILGRLLGK